VRDAFPLLDHQQVDESRQRVPQQPEIFFPIARRQRERLHLVEGQRQRSPVTLARRNPEVVRDPLQIDP